MASTDTAHGLWVAYGPAGVVGSIRHDETGYTVTMAGADEATGTYPTMEVAKNALHAHLKPGSDWPQFRQH
ncbi:methyltransferase [Microbacterium xanthum]|uniref:methyltransferase n=1 Tax=Microbacterium xanthum TaxID=3079794 RepID=UPI002AD1D845|nr:MULTISPECIES: methyltransferase [unclassified Microbacterium]MDZ8172370.1 methyltransferase [Microbacterium sp. KSW-48]MDZ8201912.1 methyltransferase [Microbacterium sp. SSW1-59]